MNIIQIFTEYYQYFLRGTRTTILISLITVFCGAILGCLVALMRISNCKPLQAFSKLYITVIRGTPMLVQLYIVYYQLSFIQYPSGTIWGVDMERAIPCVIALSLNSAAYIAEVFRAGIQAVDVGQMEAARSCGMTSAQAMRFIILPQAIKNVLPALANEVVTMVKESSICSTLGMAEIMYAAQTVSGTSYITLAPYVFAAIIYFCINYPASKAIEAIERRMRRGDKQ